MGRKTLVIVVLFGFLGLAVVPAVVPAVLPGTFRALAMGATLAQASLPAPVPLLPENGEVIIIPTFSWMSVPGAAKYEVAVGPAANPAQMYWTDTTRQLVITPVTSLENGALYWRVRALDEANNPGAWSGDVFFTKQIPAPTLLAPPDHTAAPVPIFQWTAVPGAVSYRVELYATPPVGRDNPAGTWLPDGSIVHSGTTYGTTYIPLSALSDSRYYWRVCGRDTEANLDHGSTLDKYKLVDGTLRVGNLNPMVSPKRRECLPLARQTC